MAKQEFAQPAGCKKRPPHCTNYNSCAYAVANDGFGEVVRAFGGCGDENSASTHAIAGFAREGAVRTAQCPFWWGWAEH